MIFKTAFFIAFSPVSDAAAAKIEMKLLYQDKSIDDYIAQFQTIVARTRLTKEASLIEYFLDSLDKAITKQMFLMETLPTTLEQTYATAAWIYQNLQRVKGIMARGRERLGASAKMTEEQKDKKVKITISCLLIEKWEKHMKQGLCFRCYRAGHCAVDHNPNGSLKKGTYSTPRTTQFITEQKPVFKRTGAQIYTSIKAIMA